MRDPKLLPVVQRVGFCLHQNEEPGAAQGDGMMGALLFARGTDGGPGEALKCPQVDLDANHQGIAQRNGKLSFVLPSFGK